MQKQKPTKCCRWGTAIGVGVAVMVAVGFAIGVSVASSPIERSSARHERYGRRLCRGVTAGAALGSGIYGIMAIGSSIMMALSSA
jgi:hypothetical protein